MDEQLNWMELSEKRLEDAYRSLSEVEVGSDEYKQLTAYINEQSKVCMKLAEDEFNCQQQLNQNEAEQKEKRLNRVFDTAKIVISLAGVVVPIVVATVQHKHASELASKQFEQSLTLADRQFAKSIELLKIADGLERNEGTLMTTAATRGIQSYVTKVK